MNLNRILTWAVIVGLFGLLFLPLYVADGMFFPFITGKNFAFRIIVEIVFAIWLVLLARKAVSFPKLSWVFISVTSFVVVASLAAIFGENPYRSFWSNYERMDGLINLLHLFAYFFIMTSVLVKEKIWAWYMHTTLGVATIISIISLLQFTGKAVISQSTTRIDATFGNATYLAIYMLFHIFIALYFLARRDLKIWHRALYGGLIVLFGFILYHTATRGAILGLFGGLLLTFILSIFNTTGRIRRWSIGVMVLILAIAGTFYLARDSEFVRRSPTLVRFSDISLRDSTTKTRFIIWEMSLRGAAEHPILGWGPENYNIVFNKYYDPRLHSQETWFDRAHNVFLDWLVAGGILGLLFYLSIFFATFWTIWKRASSISPLQKSVLTGLFLGYLFQNLFVFDNLTSYVLFFIMVAFVQSLADKEINFLPIRRFREFGANLRDRLHVFQPIMVVLVIIFFSFIVYTANVKPIMANNLMLRSLYPRSISTEKLNTLKHIFDLETFGSMEAREQLIFSLTELRNIANLDQNLMIQYLDLGLSQMLLQLKRTENDARHQLFMGSFLHAYGKTDEALIYYQNALKLSPKKQLIYNSITRVYLDKGNFPEALKYSKESFELDKSYSLGLIEYIVTAIYARDFALVDSLIESNNKRGIVTDPRIIQAFVQVGKINKVIDIWEKEVENSPDNIQNYFSLAASYYVAGRDANAIAILGKLITLAPSTKEQAEYYIGEIRKGSLPRI